MNKNLSFGLLLNDKPTWLSLVQAKLHKSTVSIPLNSHNCQSGTKSHSMLGWAKYEQVGWAVVMGIEYECSWDFLLPGLALFWDTKITSTNLLQRLFRKHNHSYRTLLREHIWLQKKKKKTYFCLCPSFHVVIIPKLLCVSDRVKYSLHCAFFKLLNKEQEFQMSKCCHVIFLNQKKTLFDSSLCMLDTNLPYYSDLQMIVFFFCIHLCPSLLIYIQQMIIFSCLHGCSSDPLK